MNRDSNIGSSDIVTNLRSTRKPYPAGIIKKYRIKNIECKTFAIDTNATSGIALSKCNPYRAVTGNIRTKRVRYIHILRLVL
jgi:hypothetical protein